MGIFSKILLLLFIIFTFKQQTQTQAQNTTLLPKLLKKEKAIDSILSNPECYDVQIIYTKIERGKDKIKFRDFYYKVNDKNYFYPSTAVNLPVAVLALEKINSIAQSFPDVNKDRYVKIDSPLTLSTLVYQDTTSVDSFASYSNFIKKMFLVRDHNAYNYCYDLLNQRYVNERMHVLGYNNSWFLNKLNDENPQSARQTNTITFFRNDVKSYFIDIIYLKKHITTIPFFSIFVKKGELNSIDYYSNRKEITLGNKHILNKKEIDAPKDFTYTNKYGVEDMHRFIKAVIFPETQTPKFNLTDSDYSFLYKYMQMYPANSNHPAYSSTTYPNNSFKYILGDKTQDPSIKIFNNSGKDLGFMVDNAYVIDTKNGVEFLLTVMIKCNRDNVFGEEYYEYEKIGLPFIRYIGNFIHQYEIDKKKKSLDFGDFLNTLNEYN